MANESLRVLDMKFMACEPVAICMEILSWRRWESRYRYGRVVAFGVIFLAAFVVGRELL